MGAKLSCLINGIYIGDYPNEAPVPARPISQQQLSHRQRQPLHLEYSNDEDDEDVARYRRQHSQPRRRPLSLGRGDEEDADRFSSSPPQRQRAQSLRLEHEGGHNEENADFPYPSSRRQTTQRLPPLRREYSYNHHDHGDTPRLPRQSSPRQLPQYQHPRRHSLPLEHDYDPDILRHERRPHQPTRPRYEIMERSSPMNADHLPEREDQSLHSSQNGLEEAPPSYEEHVYDRRVDDA
ncbi:MAG: hypothetical protein Q9175_007107 [Cornicularia normoerica]